MTTDTSELRQLGSDLEALADAAPTAAAGALDDIADEALEDYRQAIPAQPSGRTRDGAARNDADATRTGANVEIGNTWFVARFLEEGTVRQEPRPHLDDAVDTALNDLGDRFDHHLSRTLRR